MSVDLNTYVKKVVLIDTRGSTHYLTGSNPEAQLQSIKIIESIELNTIAAELQVIDTGINMIGSIPIVGTEKVIIEIQAPNVSEKIYKYEFVIYGIRNRIVSQNVQMYVLDLFSVEALRNETIRISKAIVGEGKTIVNDILKNYIGSSKTFDGEVCKYETKYIPSLRRPFDIINSLLPECVPSTTNPRAPALASKIPGSGGTNNIAGGQTSAATKNTVPIISGSAGYMFFETWNGFVFKSIDTLIKENQNKHSEYIYGTVQSDISSAKTNNNVILNYSFGSQENILQKMRYGVYSSMISFFNPSSCEYEEYFFDLSKEYPQMVHLGTDQQIPDNIKKLSEYPSRIMLEIYDHETFYNKSGIADPKLSNNPTPYPDYRKQWLAQSMSRNTILNNQVLNITIPINFSIRAGDKLKVQLPNLSVASKRKDQKYDKKNSGLYLVKNISYDIIRDNEKGPIAVCNATLIRDNLGS